MPTAAAKRACEKHNEGIPYRADSAHDRSFVTAMDAEFAPLLTACEALVIDCRKYGHTYWASVWAVEKELSRVRGEGVR